MILRVSSNPNAFMILCSQGNIREGKFQCEKLMQTRSPSQRLEEKEPENCEEAEGVGIFNEQKIPLDHKGHTQVK